MTPQEKLDYAERIIKSLILTHKSDAEKASLTSSYYDGLISAYEFCLELLVKGNPYANPQPGIKK